MSRLIDISPRISPALAVWPGDVGFEYRPSLRIADGANIDLGAIHTTVHVGAHADAPSHYRADGAAIAERPLELYYGACQVMEVAVSGRRIEVEDLASDVREPRVLFRTGSFPDLGRFSTDFASLSPRLVAWLGESGVRLVGIDTPSVDPYDDRELLAHQELYRWDMANLEGLVLDGVAPGRYTLAAFPLSLEGADGSPVRAVLVEE